MPKTTINQREKKIKKQKYFISNWRPKSEFLFDQNRNVIKILKKKKKEKKKKNTFIVTSYEDGW